MNFTVWGIPLLGLCSWLFLAVEGSDSCTGNTYDVYYSLASTDQMQFFLESVGPISAQPPPTSLLKIVTVDVNDTHQSMLGFGAALSGSSAYLLQNSPHRDEILESLFDRESGIGINYLRLPMGGSDFQPEFPYTYNDLPPGETDYPLEHFSTEADTEFIVPVLQKILEINPEVLIFAIPWSAPAWMKTSDDLFYGLLKYGCLHVYADYFVRFLQDYQSYGINITAIGVQNEPNHEAYTYPSMGMSPQQTATFIKILKPKMVDAGFGDVNVVIYNHNWDNVGYPITVLNDDDAKQYVSGTAFHCYAGDPGNTILVHKVHPDKDIYFTECTGGEWATDWDSNLWWNTYNLFINQTRQYARTVLFWNLALDEEFGPKWDPAAGCADCRGVITVDGVTGEVVSVNVEAYVLEQFNKFVDRGAVRVGSTEEILDGAGDIVDVYDVSNVAFINPDGQLVVQVMTGWEHNDPISLRLGEEYYTVDWAHIPGVGPDDHKQFITSLITFVQRCE